MNLLNFSNFIRISVLTLCLVVLLPVMSANAQNSNTNVRTEGNTRVVERNVDNGFDWGWLGLLGLLGLLPMLMRPSAPATVHRVDRVDDDATRRQV